MASIVTVIVLSPDTRSERRFDLHLNVAQLKGRLEVITGIPVAAQLITLHASENEQPLAYLDDDTRPLGYYSVQHMQVLKIQDTNPSASFTGQFTDVSQVEKFELSQEEYSQRQDTVLAFKERHKLGRFAEKQVEDVPTPESAVEIPVGARCQVTSGDDSITKRGVVRYVGPTKFGKGGQWVGIEYDEPLGKNDGSVEGERYFTCKDKYGVFVRPDRVSIGDYPPEELFDEEI